MRLFWLAYGEYRGRRTVEAFLRYYRARVEQYVEDFAFKNYLADSLYLSGQGKAFTARYVDQLNYGGVKEKEKSPDEIVTEVMKNAGLKFG